MIGDRSDEDLRQDILKCLREYDELSKLGARDSNKRIKQKETGINIDHTASNPSLFGSDINIDKITPRLILCSDKEMEMWHKLESSTWSTLYQSPIGRQLKYIAIDDYHQMPIGIFSIQSPILRQRERDSYLGMNKDNVLDKIQHGMNTHRCGAVHPYNKILGSRLVASYLLADQVYRDFKNKYSHDLRWITASGAFGATPIYDRHTINGMKLSFKVGYSAGFGTFQFPQAIYKRMHDYLAKHNPELKSKMDKGRSRKMRIIAEVLRMLKIHQSAKHGIRRSIYVFKYPEGVNPLSVQELTDHWRTRWRGQIDKKL